MTLSFGTDGMRGDARTELTDAVVAAVGRAGAEVLGNDGFAVGCDTRASGPDLAAALHRGIALAGGRSVDLGVVPTPAVARWSADELVAAAMISASHNPWSDNGVKFFAPGGVKLDDRLQAQVQLRFDELRTDAAILEDHEPVGVAPQSEPEYRHEEARERHVEAVVASIEGRSLADLTVVVDAANGAASTSGPAALRRLGASVHVLHDTPNGRNINDGCGSTHPESLQAAVVELGADAGLAFDGDADRVLAVDHRGTLIDGDHMIAVCALDRHDRDLLTGAAVAVTVMANLGFRRAMEARDIAVVETAVGDRYVLEAMDEHGLVLGGEQSGHIIFGDLATTGDGMLTAVQLLDVVVRSGRSLAALSAESMTRLPQVLQGVALGARPANLDATLAPIISNAEARIGAAGRVLVRPSGTEPLVRVMVEADSDAVARREADRLSTEIATALESSHPNQSRVNEQP